MKDVESKMTFTRQNTKTLLTIGENESNLVLSTLRVFNFFHQKLQPTDIDLESEKEQLVM
jgi:hypothetical protein